MPKAPLFAALSLCLLTVPTGCSSSDMMHGGADTSGLQSAIAAMRTESDLHKNNMDATHSLEQVKSEAARHDLKMQEPMSRMMGSMSGMSCQMSGKSMETMTNEIMGAMNMHASQMGGVTTLEAGRTHCADHYLRTKSMLDSMDAARASCRAA